MKHFLFMLAVTLFGSAAAIAVPFWGIMLYYSFATLRPQYLWEWSLVNAPELRWSMFAALVGVVATLVNLPDVIKGFRGNKIMLLLAAYVVLMLLSLLTAFDPSTSMYWVQQYGKIFLMAFIASLVIQRFWQVRAMGVMIALCLGYIAYEVNFLYLFNGGRLDIFHQGYGGLDNNGAGAMIVLGLPFAYFLATTPVGSWTTARRLFGCMLGLSIMHAVMMTFSRGAMLAAIVGLVWLILNHRPRIQAVTMSLVLAAAVFVMAGDEIRDRFMSTANYQTDVSAQSRFDSWSAAFEMAMNHPLLGSGIRNSNTYSQNYGADNPGRTIHNQYLQIAADSGIPAAGVYILMIGLGVYGLGRARKHSLEAERTFALGPEPAGPHSRDALIARARDAGLLCLSLQTALIMFAFSSLFLSVELVEVPWLLLLLSGILPAAVNRRLRGLGLHEDERDDNDVLPEPPHKFGPTPQQRPERFAA